VTAAAVELKARQELEVALRERVKEFECLLELAEIIERARGSLDRILRETVGLLRRSWHAPSPWTQISGITVDGRPVGRIEVSYLVKRPDRDEGPFLAEERRLIDAVARRLSQVGEHLQSEARLLKDQRELRKRLAHLARVSVMGELAGSIAHEVNQPLTAIATFAQACRRLIEAGQLGKLANLGILARIEEEALRAGTIIHQLENMVRGHGSERAECDVNRLVREIERLTVPDSRFHDVQLRFEIAEDLPPVLADGVQLQQVMLNLIRNAVDATVDTDPERRSIFVTTETSNGAVRVSVKDWGLGLSDADTGKLFQPFFTTKPGGTGMGLSICRSIVGSHGGEIRFAGNPEGGATFFFTVPMCSEAGHGNE
jgi:C4-dicarboxylate-specific signal transduction histidine kinase